MRELTVKEIEAVTGARGIKRESRGIKRENRGIKRESRGIKR